MLGILRWIITKIAAYWDAVSAIAAWLFTLAGGVLTGWAAYAAGLFSAYAPFSWVVCGISGALVVAAIFWLVAKASYWIVQAKWAKVWNSPGDGVNPMDDSFSRKRIKINDFVSPAHGLIENKVFDRCELIGPALVLLNGGQMHSPQLLDCNFVCCKDNVPVFNAIVLKDSSLINCKLYRMTFLISESSTGILPAVSWMSRTPAEFGLPVPWVRTNGPAHSTNRAATEPGHNMKQSHKVSRFDQLLQAMVTQPVPSGKPATRSSNIKSG